MQILILSFLASGQTNDSCQCRLVFGNWFYPTLVTYHHDSLVTYTRAFGPNKKALDLNQKYHFNDTILSLEMYDWNLKTSKTLLHQKGNIGLKFNDKFYVEYPNKLIDSGKTLKTFWLGKGLMIDTSVTFLYSKKMVFEKPEIINQEICNCFNEFNYLYTPILPRQAYPSELDNINFTDSHLTHLTNDSNLFIPTDSRCYFGSEQFKECYLKGIGIISLQEPYPASTKIKVIFLTKSCDKFLKTNFFKTDN